MGMPNKIQAALTGGELAPALYGRVDLAKFSIGAKVLKNGFVHPEGGFSNREGTRYVFDLGSDCRFVPFRFSSTQSYQVCLYGSLGMLLSAGEVVTRSLVHSTDEYEWAQVGSTAEYKFQLAGGGDPAFTEPLAMWINDAESTKGTVGSLAAGTWGYSGGYIYARMPASAQADPDDNADGFVKIPYVFSTPYVADDLPKLTFSQLYDTLLFSTADYPDYKLQRFGHTDWRWTQSAFVGGPFGDINTEPSKTLGLSAEWWTVGRTYPVGSTVITGVPDSDLIATWVGTATSFANNAIIAADGSLGLDSAVYGPGGMFYKAPTVASGRTTTYPYTLIRIDHDAVVLTGNKVAISLKYSVAGGATTYTVASGVVVDVITLASVKYITLNLGWKFTRTDSTGAVYDAGCIPTYTLYPAVPSGLTFPAYVTTLYSQRIWVMMFGTGDAAKQGGGAQLTNAANQVSGTNTTTSFKAKRTNTGVALPTAPNSNDAWLYVASIPTELTSATITADGHEPFTADHVGMLIGLTDPLKDQCVTKEQTAATTDAAPAYSATILTTGSITMTTFNSWKGTVHLVKSIDDGVTWEICGSVASPTQNAFNGTLTREAGSKPTLFKARIIHTSGTCNVTLTADSAITHIAEIVAYIDPQHVAARMQSGTTYKFSTHLWYIGMFGKPVGYAQATSFFQQRRVLACTEKATNVIWMSRTGEYDNFAVSSMQLATEPVILKASATEMEDIRHVIALRSLLVLSSGGWYSLGTDADGLTPTNGTIVRQGYSGFAQYIRPEIFGMSVVALGDDLRTISEIRYSLAADGYDRADLNVLSRHLFAGKKVVGWAKQENPNYLLWTILDDGTGAILTFLKDQEVFAWTRFDTDGEIMQISSNKSPTQDDDEVYMLVKRAIGGVDKYYIEYIGERLPGSVRKEGVFVDSAIRYSGAAATTISGLKHLAGKAVSVLADGLVVEGKTVSNAGTITLTTAASVVHVGLPYTSEIETLNIELQEGTTSQGRKKAVRKVVVRVTDSAGFTIGPDRGRQTRPTQWDDLHGDDLFNGDIDHRIKGDWDQDGGLVIQQTQPLPMTVQCIIPFIDRGE